MKTKSYLLRLAASAFFSTIAVFSVSAGEIQFWEMPKGCSWTVEYSNGNVWVSTFQGKQSGQYVVTTQEKTGRHDHISTTEYNERGLMTRRIWNGNKWEYFEPYSCFGVAGECTNTYRNADGIVAKTTSRTTRINATTYRVRAKSDQSGKYSTDTVKTTHFGLTLSSKNTNFSSKLTEFRNCNALAS